MAFTQKATPADGMARYEANRCEDIVTSQYCPQRPYLELLIPEEVAEVEKLVFTVISHDQGYCEAENTISWSWFDASVSRPPSRDRILPQCILQNELASREYRHHVVVWQVESAESDFNSDSSTRKFLGSIRHSDVIQVTPRAMFPGWSNHVRSIRIEAYCRLSEPSISAAPLPIGTGAVSKAAGEAAHNPLYRPLAVYKKEIRLLCLDPGESDDELSGSFIVSALDAPEMPVFEALSYCWGSGSSKGFINLSSGQKDHDSSKTTLAITANLNEALRYLRKELTSTCRIIWIDALCINQDDVSERGSQVGMMGEIYSRAASVVVWLGLVDSSEPATAKETVNMINKVAENYTPPTKTKGGVLLFADQLPVSEQNALFPRLTRLFTAFFNRPWFQRVWVVQEAWLSKKAVMYLGEEKVSWAAVMLVNYWMVNTRGGGFPGIAQVSLPSLWARIAEHQNLISSVRHSDEMTPRMKILDLVLEGAELAATDPRDRIFALLGLGEETHQRDQIPAPLQPNYTKTTSQVYVDFTLWWINKYQSLAILSAVHAAPGRTWQDLRPSHPATPPPTSYLSNYPSWALPPTGRARYANMTLGLRDTLSHSLSLPATVPVLFPSPDPLNLVLAGVSLATITAITSYPYTNLAPTHHDKSNHHASSSSLHAIFHRIFDPSSSLCTWSRETTPTGADVGPETTAAPGDSDVPLREDQLKDHLSIHNDDPSGAEFPCLTKCLFTTAERKLTGLCPTGVEAGDVIVFLHGGRVLYALRHLERQSKTGVYRFLGECYVEHKEDEPVLGAGWEMKKDMEIFTLV
ncbi:heterokaryon incompatibility protein-domain-containing protein, partial [Rhypophila decipiens]